MRVTLLISSDAAFGLQLARAWREQGDSVTAVLCDRAAAWVRPGHRGGEALRDAVGAGVVLAVHDEAVRRRGVATPGPPGIKQVDLDELADLVTDGADRVVWW